MSGIAEARIEDEGRALRLRWADGAAARFHAVWLRDNCQDPQSRHPGSGQRLFDILDLPDDIRIASTTPIGEELEVGFAPDGHGTRFTGTWLRDHAYADTAPGRPDGCGPGSSHGMRSWRATCPACPTRRFAATAARSCAGWIWLPATVSP